jgi:hypothetical protein
MFTLILSAASLLLMSSICSLFASLVAVPDTGVLDVDIDYMGRWSRDTFNYSRKAENIRHFVLVMPESEADRASAAAIFTRIEFDRGRPTVSDE